MKTITCTRFIPVLLLLAFAPPVWSGGPPELLSYQGYLVDSDGVPLGTDGEGNPLPANYDVTFSIFDASSGGNLLWVEQQTITVDNGYFSVLLGEGAEFGSDPRPDLSSVFSGFDAAERFIGVAVRFDAGSDVYDDILPRLRLLTSPYAFLSSQTRSMVNDQGQSLVTTDGSHVTIAGGLSADTVSGSGSNLTGLNAESVTLGVFHAERIPNLNASKITSGTFSASRLPASIGGTRTFTGDLRADGRFYVRFSGTRRRLIEGLGGNAVWSSDERLKENIVAIPSPLETVKKLRGVTWDWNEEAIRHFTRNVESDYLSLSGTPEDNRQVWEEKRREIVDRYSRPEIGFVAQEVERVFPDWVTTSDDGYKQINMERLSALLLSAILEQQEQIESLREEQASRLASLESENRELKKMLEEMTQAQRRQEAVAASDRARLEALEERMAPLMLTGADAPVSSALDASRARQ